MTPQVRLDAVTTVWSNAGSLNNARHYHGAIFDGENFLVVGGEGTLKNEVCSLTDQTVTCTEASSTLDNYYGYPELFLVPADFGSDPEQC